MDYYKATEAMLYNYNATKAAIKNIEIEIEEVKNDYTGCGSMTYEEKSAPTNKFNSSVENESLAKEHRIELLQRAKMQKIYQIKKIDNALAELKPEEMKIVKLRYFDKLPFKIIGVRMNLNSDYCVQFKTKVINKLIDMIFIIK